MRTRFLRLKLRKLPYSRDPSSVQRVGALLQRCRAVDTKGSYMPGWTRFLDFLMHLEITPEEVGSEISKDFLAGFVDYLCNHLHLTKASMKQAVNGFKHYAATLDLKVQSDDKWFLLVLDGAKRLAPESKERAVRIPLTAPPLMRYLLTLDRKTFRGIMTGAMLCFGFLTAERPAAWAIREALGVLVHPMLRVKHFAFRTKDCGVVHFEQTKVGSNVRVEVMRTGNILCIMFWIDLLRAWQMKEGRFYPHDHLFSDPDEADVPLTYTRLCVLLRQVGIELGLPEGEELKGYALRRGATQTAYMLKATIPQLKSIGRHRSDAYKAYIIRGRKDMIWWQKKAIRELRPEMSWFGYLPKDRALRLKGEDVELWEQELPRGGKRWT